MRSELRKRKLDYQPNEKLATAMESYKGKWVVVVRDEVVLSGDDPIALKREADARGIEYDALDYVHDWKDFGGKPPLLIL